MSHTLYVPQIEDSIVVIAGGSSGVGLASARKFAASGAGGIVLLGRDGERGAQACRALGEIRPDCRIRFLQCDVNDPAAVADTVSTIVDEFHHIDILLNATVGSAVPTPFHMIELGDLPGIVASFLLGPILLSRAALPHMMRRNGGVIINVASDAAKVPTPGETVIGAAMAGIAVFTRTLAQEAKRHGVRVNALTPSIIEGTLSYDRVFSDPFSARLFEKACSKASLGIVQPEDLAEAVFFLASPQSKRITGQVMSVNGGISAG